MTILDRTSRGPALVLVALLATAALSISGCCVTPEETGAQAEAVREAKKEQPVETEAQAAGKPFELGDTLKFRDIRGTGLAYHMSPVYNTPIWVEEGGGRAWAGGTYQFEEPAGVQTMKGTDVVKFEGTYDQSSGLLEGTYSYTMDGESTGGDAPPLYHQARLKGKLRMVLRKGETGTLDGTYSVGSADSPSGFKAGVEPAKWTFQLDWQ